jgi:hypothetical protein
MGSTGGETETRTNAGHPVGTPLVAIPRCGLQELEADD